MELFKNIVIIMGFLGIPSLFSIILYFVQLMKKNKKKTEEKNQEVKNEIDILKRSQQVQLRHILLCDAIKHINAGYISREDLDLWLDLYESYHELGSNGVMDIRKDQILHLTVR